MESETSLITVKELKNLKQWDEIESSWDDLFARTPEASVFNSFAFLKCYCKRFLVPGKNVLSILIVQEPDGKIIGVAPMVRLKRWVLGFPVRVVSLVYHHYVMDRPQFLLPARRKEQLQAIFQFLRDNKARWDVIELKEQVLDPEYEAVFQEVFKNTFEFHKEAIGPSVEPFLKLESGPDAWETYLATRSKNHRKKWRNKNSRLNRLGGITLTRHVGSAEIYTAIQEYRDLEVKSWKQHRKAQIDEYFYKFYQDVAEAVKPNGALHILFLRRHGTPIAGHIGLSFHKRYAALQFVFDRAYESFSPGFLIGGHDLKWTMENGFTEYDFMSGFLNEKLSWTDSYRRTCFLRIVRKKAWAGFFYFTKFRIAPIIRSSIFPLSRNGRSGNGSRCENQAVNGNAVVHPLIRGQAKNGKENIDVP